MKFEAYAAEHLVAEHASLTEEWLRRVEDQRERDSVAALHVAAHMPAVFERTAAALVDDTISLHEDPSVLEPLATLARLRHGRGCKPCELMREFEILALVLDEACGDWLEHFGDAADAGAVLRVTGRLNRAAMAFGTIAVEVWHEEESAEASRRDDLVRAFADTVAHELKTPLNAASMTAQLLEYAQDVPTQEARRLTALIRRNIDRADSVLRNVRSAVLPGASQEPQRVPFGQVLGSVLAELRDELAATGVVLDVEEPIPARRVDGARVKIILLNLIRNSIRYRSAAHPPTVRLRFRRVASEGVWWIEVSDNGVGIPTVHHADVFSRAFRSGVSRDGSGLGLLIVRREVEQLGGRIEFASEPGRGTTFRFSLPDDDP